MNYLSHLFLSQNTDYSRLGNFLGDFVRGNREKLLEKFHPEIVDGIQTHRMIDKYTDTHEQTKRALSILRPVHGLFSGIITDMMYDHFLSVHWSTFSDFVRLDFIDECHESLSINVPNLPAGYIHFLPILIDYDILDSYISLDGIDHALFRIDQRIKRKTTLCDAVIDIEENYEELEDCFFQFFPEICAFVKETDTGLVSENTH